MCGQPLARFGYPTTQSWGDGLGPPQSRDAQRHQMVSSSFLYGFKAPRSARRGQARPGAGPALLPPSRSADTCATPIAISPLMPKQGDTSRWGKVTKLTHASKITAGAVARRGGGRPQQQRRRACCSLSVDYFREKTATTESRTLLAVPPSSLTPTSSIRLLSSLFR